MKELKISGSIILHEIKLPKRPGHVPYRMAQCNSVDLSTKGSKRTESLAKPNIIRNRKKECYDKISFKTKQFNSVGCRR